MTGSKVESGVEQQGTFMLDVRGVAALLGVSVRHAWALDSSGRLPAPIRLGRAVRWNRADLEKWLAAGAPTRDAWQRMKGGER